MYKNAEGYPDPTQGEGSGGRSVYQGISGKGFGWPESSCGWQSWMLVSIEVEDRKTKKRYQWRR